MNKICEQIRPVVRLHTKKKLYIDPRLKTINLWLKDPRQVCNPEISRTTLFLHLSLRGQKTEQSQSTAQEEVLFISLQGGNLCGKPELCFCTDLMLCDWTVIIQSNVDVGMHW